MFNPVPVPSSISFGQRLAASPSFGELFRDGMTLVEETATYLDGAGREAAQKLPRGDALVYAAESMRLTTRLMQIASWLLLQRAVNEGELSPNEATEEKRRSRVAWAKDQDGAERLQRCPDELEALIERSLQLQQRVQHLDTMLIEPASASYRDAHNPLASQMALLRAAFPAAL